MHISQNPVFQQLSVALEIASKFEEVCKNAGLSATKVDHKLNDATEITTVYESEGDNGATIFNTIILSNQNWDNKIFFLLKINNNSFANVIFKSRNKRWEIKFDGIRNNNESLQYQKDLTEKLLAEISIPNVFTKDIPLNEEQAWSAIKKCIAFIQNLENPLGPASEQHKTISNTRCTHKWEFCCRACADCAGALGPDMFASSITCQYCNKIIDMRCGFETHVHPIMATLGIEGFMQQLLQLDVLREQFSCKHIETTQEVIINEAEDTAVIYRSCTKCDIGKTHQHHLWGNLTNEGIKPPTFTTK